MSFRRAVAVVLLIAIAGLVLPPAAQAGVYGPGLAGDVEPSFFARVLEWAEALIAKIAPTFVAQQGSSLTGSG